MPEQSVSPESASRAGAGSPTGLWSRRVRRYLHNRRDDLFGGLRPDVWHRAGTELRAAWTELFRAPASAPLSDPASRLEAESAPAPRLTAARRRRYAADALAARIFLASAGISGVLHGHRVWIGDWSGALASLGAGLTLLSLALPPAYRCWHLRAAARSHRPVPSPRIFLRRPGTWWPRALPRALEP